MGKPAARIGDNHQCPETTAKVSHIGGPVAAGSSSITINGMPAARKGDKLICVGPPDTIKEGSSSVFIDGKPAARMGDGTAHGGQIVAGSGNVFIGNAGKSPAASSSSGSKAKTSESKQSESKSESSSNPSSQSGSSQNSGKSSKAESRVSQPNSAQDQINTATNSQNEVEEVALPISIVPIRYAYDTEFLANPPPAPYAQHKLNKVLPKITRQLRDGWVYVFNETTKELKEHQINGAVISNGGIQYPEGTTLSLAFSLFQWTPRIKNTLSEQAYLRTRFMRRIRCQQTPQKHTSNAEGLDYLADNHVEHQFAHSSASASGQSEHPLNHVKPAFDSAQWLANATTPDKLVVALDDPYSDLQDLTYPILHHVREYLMITEGDEETQHKLLMAGIVRNLARVQIDQKHWPSKVTQENYVQFEQDLHQYLVALDVETMAKQVKNTNLANTMRHGSQHSTKAREKLLNIWGYQPSGDIHAQWAKKKSLNKYVDWSRLDAFSTQLDQQLDRVDAQLGLSIDLLCALIRDLDDDPISLGIDNQTKQGVDQYLDLMDLVVTTLKTGAEHREKSQSGVNRLLSERTILAYAPYGGSKALAQAIARDFNHDADFAGMSRFSDLIGVTNNFSTWVEQPDVREQHWFSILDEHSKKVMQAITSSVVDSTSGAFDRILLALFPLTPSTGSQPKRLLLMSLWGATVNRFTLKINRDYIQASQTARQQLRDIIEHKKRLYDEKIMSRKLYQQRALELLNLQKRFAKTLQNTDFITIVNNDRSTQFRAEVSRQVEQYVSASYNNFKEKAAHGAQSVGGLLNSTIVLINLLNLQTSMDTLRSLPEESKQYRKAWEDLSISFLWTLHAIGATAESAAKYWLGRNTGMNLLKVSIKEVSSIGETTLTSRMTTLLFRGIAVGCFAGAAAAIWDAYRDLKRAQTEKDPLLRALIVGRSGALLAQALVLIRYFDNVILKRLPLSIALPTWAPSTLFWGSAVFLVLSILIYLLEKTPLEKWLSQSKWGADSKSWPKEIELNKYYSLIFQPTAKIQDIQYTTYIEDITYFGKIPIKPESYIVDISFIKLNQAPFIEVCDTNVANLSSSKIIDVEGYQVVRCWISTKLNKVKLRVGYEGGSLPEFIITLNSQKKVTIVSNTTTSTSTSGITLASI
ncbi:PAAR domain-containing protein [Vibrio maritimus]